MFLTRSEPSHPWRASPVHLFNRGNRATKGNGPCQAFPTQPAHHQACAACAVYGPHTPTQPSRNPSELPSISPLARRPLSTIALLSPIPAPHPPPAQLLSFPFCTSTSLPLPPPILKVWPAFLLALVHFHEVFHSHPTPPSSGPALRGPWHRRWEQGEVPVHPAPTPGTRCQSCPRAPRG